MLLIGENILWLLVLIGVMIMIHELGHFGQPAISMSR